MDAYPLAAETSKATGELQLVWQGCLAKIQSQVTSLSYKTWFQPITPLKLEGKEITVQVPSQFFYDWVDQHYNSLIRETIASVLGEDAKLYYSIASDDSEPPAGVSQDVFPAQPDSVQRYAPPAVTQPQPFFPPRAAFRQTEQPIAQSNLNPRYTFENFIKGDSNQLARAAALAVGNNPGGTSFNPLVIYGGTGLEDSPHACPGQSRYRAWQGEAGRLCFERKIHH